MNVISNLMLPLDGQIIINTPISGSHEDDRIQWNASSDGIFRVHDTCKIAQSREDSGSCSRGPDPLWKMIWGLLIPPKAKILPWCAFWDILPHGANLSRKEIEGVGSCPRCGEREDNLHVLRDCDWARRVWKNLPEVPFDTPSDSFKEWVASIVNNKTYPTIELVCMCA